MIEFSHEERDFLRAGYNDGFVITQREEKLGVIRTAQGPFPQVTHMALLDKLRAQGLVEMRNGAHYILTKRGRQTVDEMGT